MNATDVEAQLREMYEVKAAAITDADLSTQQLAGPGDASRTGTHVGARARLRRLTPLLASAAVVALAAGIVAITRTDGRHHAPVPTGPAGLRSVAPLPSGPGKQLRHGEVGRRTDVPWGLVGRGWTVALWSDGTTEATTLFLVNPVGGRYLIADVGTTQVVQWSPDVRDVLLADYNTGTTKYLDLVTGTIHAISARRNVHITGVVPAPNFGVIGYTQGLHGRILSFGLVGPDGTIATPFPKSVPGAGSLSPDSDPPITTSGGALVIGGSSGIALVTVTGRVTGVLAPPAGSTTCQPASMWSPTVLMAKCRDDQDDTGAYLIPLDGSTPTPLTLAAPPPGTFGVVDAWAMTGHTLVTLGTGCGPPVVELVGSDGAHPHFSLPRAHGTAGTVVPVDAYGTTVIARTTGARGCAGGMTGPSLMTYDIHTHETTVLLGPGLNGGAVLSLLAWPGR